MSGVKSLLSLVSAAGLSFMATCGSEPECYSGYYRNVTSYEVNADRYTQKGIGLDDPIDAGHILDADEVDWQVDDLESCLHEQFSRNPVISSEDAKNAGCLKTDFSNGFGINRECLIVKVPDDLYRSPCTGRLLFECNVDEQLCRDKGFEPDPNCPCNCRATVQDDNYIITEPRLEVFRAELARIVTSCNNPWVVEQVVGCLRNPHFSEE